MKHPRHETQYIIDEDVSNIMSELRDSAEMHLVAMLRYD